MSYQLYCSKGVGLLPSAARAYSRSLRADLQPTLYLGAFCLAATLTMATVAGVFGACTHGARLVSSRLPWVLQCASATTSVGVGVLWLWCSATGTLAEVLAAMGME